ncbi:tetratricopeptide repeat protein [Streptomyces sp. NPDC051963]|uniref:tetratricopeptide repeat protein n=1 Tax=Streptomyces sp. NPDC051963 TaxID=3365678 RepID=UPI0037D5D8C2
MSVEYDDHFDFRGGQFTGPVIGRADYQPYVPAPTAVDSLPARTVGFTGRDDELRKLLEALDPAQPGPQAVLVAAVSGLGGIGKTALAVEAAHEAQARGWFPGGTLFVDLHGYDESPISADVALQLLLRALGTRPEHIPVQAEERSAFYRAALARRARESGPVLVVADNASSVSQVRPLLPGDFRHRMLTTSRHRFPTLGARLLALDELSTQGACELLDRALHAADPADARMAGHASQASALAALCGCLPLALQIAAALLIADHSMSLSEFGRDLTASRSLLDQLDDGERSVRATFELSYRALPAQQARLLRLLALAPGPETGIEAITALLGEANSPRADLAVLERAHLIQRGSSRHRWRMHDLVREYAAQVAESNDVLAEESAAARERVLEHYVQRTAAAVDLVRWWTDTPVPQQVFSSRAQAVTWLDTERANLLATMHGTAQPRHGTLLVRLGLLLGTYLYFRRYYDDFVTVSRHTQDTARLIGDRVAEAQACNYLGLALRSADRPVEAIDALTRARDLLAAVGDRTGEAFAWNFLGSALRVAGSPSEALPVLERAGELFRALSDSNGQAYVFNNTGFALMDLGRPHDAIDAHTRARKLFRTAGNRDREAKAWRNTGIALQATGNTAEAVDAYTKALTIQHEFEDWHAIGTTHQHLADAHENAGHLDEARHHWLAAADAYQQADAEPEAVQARERATALPPPDRPTPPPTSSE